MKREEALSLIRDLMIVCETLRFAPIVSMEKSELGQWKVRVKWDSNEEKGCFDNIILERGLQVTEDKAGYTVFVKADVPIDA